MDIYSFNSNGNFTIKNFNHAEPFASFLPGISGKSGIPLWSFYVNRGQGLSSFGVGGKHNPILEFFPADQAFRNISLIGFRSFIKTEHGIYEPFMQDTSYFHEMEISYETFRLMERNEDLGIKVTVSYVTVAERDYPGLIRKLEIRNLGDQEFSFELIDGLPRISPYGVDEFSLKSMSFTSQAWMEVVNLDEKIPFYKVKASMGDHQNVQPIKSGNFYLCRDEFELLDPIVDPKLIFGQDWSFRTPLNFSSTPISEILKQEQITFNATPSGLFGKNITIESNSTYTLYSLVGQVHDINFLNEKIKNTSVNELEAQFDLNSNIISQLGSEIMVISGNHKFDRYIVHSYLDNILRGGHPWIFSNDKKSHIYYLYNRKHGDLERDYNQFFLAPEYWSQGNGNYRDINQNRRIDVLINPEVGKYNITTFMNLIQADGYNPLVLTGSYFRFEGDEQALDEYFPNHSAALYDYISNNFTPGGFLEFLRNNDITSLQSPDLVLKQIILGSVQIQQSVHGEGYWVDHFGYNIDLIQTYLQIFPERLQDLFFNESNFIYHDSEVYVKPLFERISLEGERAVIVDSLFHDVQKFEIIQSRNPPQNSVRLGNEIYKTNLFEKLLSLVSIKFSTLDPQGFGLEMEAGKPGWYDALNGLPGMMGSSAADTMVLKQFIDMMVDVIETTNLSKLALPIELVKLLSRIQTAISSGKTSIWLESILAREEYREEIRDGFKGKEEVEWSFIMDLISGMQKWLYHSIERMVEVTNGGLPTYFYYEIENINDFVNDGELQITRQDYGKFNFKCHKFPLFLEGFVKGMRHGDRSSNFYQKVISSELYDEKLKMFRVNTSLQEENPQIGRAWSFVPGWLENGSIWKHMEYKFLLELLKCGLHEEFYEHLQNIFIPFLDPEIYRRNPLENSSFIVSSVYPDKKRHGQGYYARLTGATVEVLSIYFLMFLGPEPYIFKDNTLFLKLRPSIPSWLFDNNGKIEFMLHGTSKVIYTNPNRKNTHLLEISNIKVDGEMIFTKLISEPLSSSIRSKNSHTIEVVLQ